MAEKFQKIILTGQKIEGIITKSMNDSLKNLSPLDGRYQNKTKQTKSPTIVSSPCPRSSGSTSPKPDRPMNNPESNKIRQN